MYQLVYCHMVCFNTKYKNGAVRQTSCGKVVAVYGYLSPNLKAKLGLSELCYSRKDGGLIHLPFGTKY